ncbi:uncharacterized protein LOC107369602 [Tetranychus urticae]|uniref:Uncharacterized protein n=1 Tax=Tetranychus urticae TaxID=32264 RepID=T1L2M6_TETUR|nr:uncharacterized protein LOC107369392 [Tetranychus urticae]XP_015793056.1 uncharacterized protein LOC107369602 [Tetranychus urticae]
MRFLVILCLALCIGFAYAASVNRSKRDIKDDMQKIIKQIKKKGIDHVGGEIKKFAHTFKDQIKSWHCPNFFEILKAMASKKGDKIAKVAFETAVCKALKFA